MAKRMIEKKCDAKFLIIISVILIITVLLIIGKGINKLVPLKVKKMLPQNEVSKSVIKEEEYIIEDFENFSFQNAQIKTENGISYINIELKNNSNEKSQIKQIIILLSGKTKQLELAYTLPEIEANTFYNMQLNVIEDLSDILSIEIKK